MAEDAGDKLQPLRLTVRTAGGAAVVVKGSHVLLATGRTANTEGLNLRGGRGADDCAGGELVVGRAAGHDGGRRVRAGRRARRAGLPRTWRTTDFRIVRANLLPDSVPPPRRPCRRRRRRRRGGWCRTWCTRTRSWATSGCTSASSRRAAAGGRRVRTARMPMAWVARALETGEARGLMKASVDGDTGEILGFTCLGIEGGELMAVVQTAMMGGLKWWDLEAAVWAHPSLAESLNNLWGTLE